MEKMMTQKTVIECDGLNCIAEYEQEGSDFMLIDIESRGWICDYENEYHYCPRCAKQIEKDGGLDSRS